MLLNSNEFLSQLEESLSSCNKKFIAVSAFIKSEALKDSAFIDNLAGKDVVIISRWQKRDIIAKASDLEVYEICKNQGWKFGISLNLHGKVFVVDSSYILLGSANLTKRGLGIGMVGNHEFGTSFNASHSDVQKITRFLDTEVIWLTDDLYHAIKKEVEAEALDTPVYDLDWSSDIKNLIKKPVKFLWKQELLTSDPFELMHPDLTSIKTVADLDLLGIDLDDIDIVSLRRRFKELRLYQWLISILNDGPLSYGRLTAELHEAILDNPKPFRMTVKEYVKIIYKWAEMLDDIFIVTRPNHSQVLELRHQSLTEVSATE